MNNQPTSARHRFAAILAILCVASPWVARGQDPSAKPGREVYQTLYLTNLSQTSDAGEVAGTLRNLLPNAKVVHVASQGAIVFKGSPEDLAAAQKIIADLDKTKKIYRLTYTIREMEGSKVIGTQHYSMIVASGSTTIVKEGGRIPVGTGGDKSDSVTYLDIGEEIQASLDGYLDGARLRSKVVRSSIADEKSLVGTQDPVIRQTTFEGTSILVQNKPLIIGSLDVPDSPRHQEIEVVSELVR